MLIINTLYPGGIYKIEYVNNIFIINANNTDNYKITDKEQIEFMNILLNKAKSYRIISGLISKKINFQDCFVSLEDLRNIHYDIINNLIKDSSIPINNKIGTFGYLCGNTKSYRLKYIEFCNLYPNFFEYISTNKYSSTDKSMLSFIDLKKYKYLIDLPGHTYSTKMYAFLHSKRVIFKLKNINKEHEFYWEKYLKPSIHYIEIKEDFSDIIEKYNYLENNPNIVENILNNCNKLINNELKQDNLINNFLDTILL